MIRTTLIGIGCLLGFAGAANAQYYGGGYGYGAGNGGGFGGGTGGFGGQGYGNTPGVMPNIYNPRTQPLSPYLNMLRGGNAGVNYFYGVRPGTVGGAGSYGPGASMAPGGSRPATFPVQYNDPDALQLPEVDTARGYILPPAGHPVVFNNTLGYFPGGARGMGTGGAGANRQTTPRR